MNSKRIHKEIKLYQDDPPDFVYKLAIINDDLSRVYFLIEGLKDCPYENGQYVVILILPENYPAYPPKIQMLTPSGRFSVSKNICTTFTDHHKESWSPAYTFSTIMKSFVSFMLDKYDGHVGGMNASNEDKIILANKSKEYNIKEKLIDIFL